MSTVATWLFLALLAVDDSTINEATEQVGGDDIFAILEEEKTVSTSLGTATARTLNEVSSSVWIIDRQTIASSGAVTIADLLQRIPGVSVLRSTNSTSQVYLRGFGRRFQTFGTKWMLDYQAISRPTDESVVPDTLPIALDDIERIEVLLGPASTLYGANAHTGIINIVSRAASKTGWSTRATGQGGFELHSLGGNTSSLGTPAPTARVSVTESYGLGNGWVKASLSTDYGGASTLVAASPSEQVPTEPRLFAAGLLEVYTEKNGWRTRGRVSAQIGQNKRWYATPFLEREHSLQAGVFVNKDGLGATDDTLLLRFLIRSSNIQSLARLPGIGPSQSAGANNELEVYSQYSLTKLGDHRVSFGAQLIGRTAAQGVNSIIVPGGELAFLGGLFIEDEWRPLTPLIITAGVRLETFETPAFKRPFSRVFSNPRLGVVYALSEAHSLRAEVATSVLNPTASEMFIRTTTPASDAPVLVPNFALREEQQVLGSLGYFGAFDWLKLRGEIFYGVRLGENSPTRLFADRPLPNTYKAEGDSSYVGFSAHAEFTPRPELQAFAYYSFVENRDGARPFAGKWLGAPRHTVGAGIGYSMARLSLRVDSYFQEGLLSSPGFSPDGLVQTAHHVTINAFAGYFFDEEKRLQLFAVAANAADIRFGERLQRDYAEYQAERGGPRVLMGLRLQL